MIRLVSEDTENGKKREENIRFRCSVTENVSHMNISYDKQKAASFTFQLRDGSLF